LNIRILLALQFGLAASFGVAVAQEQSAVDTGADIIVDLVAADFYETALRPSQSKRIEAETAKTYRNLSEQDRERFRQDREEQWGQLNAQDKNALRGAKTPQYHHLSEPQKAPFRAVAKNILTDSQAPNSIEDEI